MKIKWIKLGHWTVPQSKVKKVHRHIVMARVHRPSLPVCEVRWQELLLPRHIPSCTARDLQRCTVLLHTGSSSLGETEGPKRGMFTCEPFPSVVWSCTSGTRCSRHPYTGPYTWQYISAQSCPVCFQVFLCTSWSICLSSSAAAPAR